jgi:hypothetical protein
MTPEFARRVLTKFAQGINPESGEHYPAQLERLILGRNLLQALHIAINALEYASPAPVTKSDTFGVSDENTSGPSEPPKSQANQTNKNTWRLKKWSQEEREQLIEIWTAPGSTKDASSVQLLSTVLARSNLAVLIQLYKVKLLDPSRADALCSELHTGRLVSAMYQFHTTSDLDSDNLSEGTESDKDLSKAEASKSDPYMDLFKKEYEKKIRDYITQIRPIDPGVEVWMVGDGKSWRQHIDYLHSKGEYESTRNRIIENFTLWKNDCVKTEPDPRTRETWRSFEMKLVREPNEIFQFVKIFINPYLSNSDLLEKIKVFTNHEE